MSRRQFTFTCEGETLAGSLDEAPGTRGLMIVSGGNEVRAGAFAGQARLARDIAAAGHPVFRFDRRGVGDSSGENRGFRASEADIAAALAAFRDRCPGLQEIVGFGNCDGASALMLSAGAGFQGMILANPWTIEVDDGKPLPAAIRSRYLQKIVDPAELKRLVLGSVSLSRLAAGLLNAARPSPPASPLASHMAAGLARFSGPVRILLAENDRTAQIFAESWNRQDTRILRCPGAGHAFAGERAGEWLLARILEMLADE